MIFIDQIRYDPVLGDFVILSIHNKMVFGFYFRTNHPSCYHEDVVKGWKVQN